MPVPEFDPRLDEAQKRLSMLVMHETNGRTVNRHTIKKVEELVHEFGVSCRLKGIDFPKCVVLGFPKMGQVAIWPLNATYNDVQVRMRNLIVQMQRIGKEIDPEELAMAVRRAYPDYGPTMSGFLESFPAEKPRLPIYDA